MKYPDTIVCYKNLASLYKKMDDIEMADKYLSKIYHSGSEDE